MPSIAPFFHLHALRAVLDGAAADPARAAGDGGLARSVFPMPFVTTGVMLWPQEQAPRVLHEWAAWTRSVPKDVTSVGRLVRYPRLAGVPGILRGRAFVAVEVAIPGEPWVALGRLAALRRLGPEIDTVTLANPAAVHPMHLAIDLPASAVGRHVPLREISSATVDAFIGAAGPASGSGLASAELRHLGVAFAVSASGRATDDEQLSHLEVRLDVLLDRLAPSGASRPRSGGAVPAR
jgi:hypothetical protein